METKDWVEVLGLLSQHPLLIVAAVVGAIAVFLFAWWLRGHIGQGEINAAQGEVRAAHQQLAPVA